jgi:putative endonuclease
VENHAVTNRRQALGSAGEMVVALWYEREGYEVVDRNWRCRRGELDLILRRRDTMVFCEVKTRRTRAYGHPAEAVTPEKRRRIRGLALVYLRDVRRGPRHLRFDVAAISGDDLEVIEAAF